MAAMILVDGPCKGARERDKDYAELTRPDELPSFTFWREQFDILRCEDGDLAWVEPAVHYYRRVKGNTYAHADICPCHTDHTMRRSA